MAVIGWNQIFYHRETSQLICTVFTLQIDWPVPMWWQRHHWSWISKVIAWSIFVLNHFISLVTFWTRWVNQKTDVVMFLSDVIELGSGFIIIESHNLMQVVYGFAFDAIFCRKVLLFIRQHNNKVVNKPLAVSLVS